MKRFGDRVSKRFEAFRSASKRVEACRSALKHRSALKRSEALRNSLKCFEAWELAKLENCCEPLRPVEYSLQSMCFA